MDNGTLALVFQPVVIILVALITNWVTRKSAKENTEIGRFEANLEAYKGRAEAAETAVKELKAEVVAKDLENDARISKLELQYTAQARQLTRIRTVVQDWFKELKLAWTGSIPMPVPSDEDLELLGITRQKKEE